MPDPKAVLLVALSVLAVAYVAVWLQAVSLGQATTEGDSRGRGWLLAVVGAVTNFFDTLGIGSFAPTTSVFKLKRLVPDRVIPGTLNVGHTLPTVVQAFIFVTAISVGSWTLISMIAAAVVGAWLGAGVVASWPKRTVQVGMGIALLVAAALFLSKAITQMQQADPTASAPTADFGTDSLEGTLFLLGIAGNFALGALMTLGIGLYAPCIVLVSLLGMNVKAAFPIMMGSCAFLMPVASFKFIKSGSYSPTAALGLALGGVPAVLVAGHIIKSLDLRYVLWLVIAVVGYTAAMMLRSAFATPTPATETPA